ncbi:MAG: hypothetical protein C4555_03135 [Dehalococcoidia bacterium]|nr:MAG: hypothetical protein C4555_03135 [Dehalococcoidia bacterium]
MALGTAVVNLGPYKDGIEIQNDFWKGLQLVQDAIQDGASSIQTAGLQIGTTASAGVFVGGGTSGTKLTNSSTTQNSMEFRFDHTGASGDIRGLYLRAHYSGGCGGEALRAFSTVDAASGTVHGAHISLSYGASPAATSGLACAIRGTLHIANRATSIGTAAAIQAEVFCDGTSSAATGTLSLFRCIVDGGDATAQNTVDYFLTGVNLGTNIFTTKTAAAVSHWLKVNINGTDYYLMVSDAA